MGKSNGSGANKSATVHSVVVASQVLEFLAASGQPQRVTDIAARLDMTKARISRHLSTLSELGFVTRMPDGSGYRLGSAVFRLAHAASEQYEITNIANRFMLALRNRISEALLLAIPAGGDALVVSTIGSGKPLSPQLSRGSRFSIPDSPTAWVILSFSPHFISDRIVARFSDSTLSGLEGLDPEEIRARMELIQKRFYDFDPDPHDAGFSVVSAPIFNYAESLEAALTVVMTRRAQNDVDETRCLRPLKEATVDISRALGSQELAARMADTI